MEGLVGSCVPKGGDCLDVVAGEVESDAAGAASTIAGWSLAGLSSLQLPRSLKSSLVGSR